MSSDHGPDSGTVVLSQSSSSYYRSPRLSQSGDQIFLHVLASENQGELLLRYAVDAQNKTLGSKTVVARAPSILGVTPYEPFESYADLSLEDRFVAGAWSAHMERAQGVSKVMVKLPFGQEICVFEAVGMAVAPYLTPTAEGAWLAFHHNVREDTHETDVAKWIALRYVNLKGQLFEPQASMTDRDRDRLGQEQSFEFPALAVGQDGALSLFGRGSHTFWKQDINRQGFSSRVMIGDEQWGCRGRRVAVLPLRAGVLTARRERAGIVLQSFDEPSGGAPQLRPVSLAKTSTKPKAASSARYRTPDQRFLLFGDVHQHSAHSDGIGSADEAYWRARHVYEDDFCALTDHESFLGKRIGAGEWDYLQAVANRYNEPSKFATLIAYEWTGKAYPGPGHKVVYYPESGLPIVSRDDVPEGHALLERIKQHGGFAAPHHVGWTGADVEAHDSHAQPVWELCSCHGCYEHAHHKLGQRGHLFDQTIEEVLKRGLMFGFVAASDSHGLLWHHGVARKRDPFRTGLTAVQAKACTREAIFEAMRERRCYATSGAKIVLEMWADKYPMGSIVSKGNALSVEARVQGTANIENLEFVGPDGVFAQTTGKGAQAFLQAQISSRYVYARVEQSDGEMAWSSPIFLQ